MNVTALPELGTNAETVKRGVLLTVPAVLLLPDHGSSKLTVIIPSTAEGGTG